MTRTSIEDAAVIEKPKSVAAPPIPPPVVYSRPLFRDSLLTGGERGRRTWATLFSLVVQVLFLGVMVLLPLMYTDVLPKQQLLTFLVAPPPPPPPPPPAAAEQIQKTIKRVQTEIVNGQLRSPTAIPRTVQMIKEEAPPPPSSGTGGVVGGVPGGIPGGRLGGVLGGIISSTPTANLPVPPKVEPVKRIRISQGVSQGMLIRRVEPRYPPIAMQARIQGQVLLSAIIAKDGSIQNLQVVSGHPMLVAYAMEAVRQWRYRPYLLNGEPVEVETQVTVNFTLTGAQ